MSDEINARSENLWFLNTRVRIHVSHGDGADGMSVIEHEAPAGDSPPLHVHRTEDELFQVVSGEVMFRVGDREFRAGAGAVALVPKGVPHSYRVLSADGGKFMTVTTRADFENFVRAASRPAAAPGLPAPSGPPSPEQMTALINLAGQYGIEFVGPPLH